MEDSIDLVNEPSSHHGKKYQVFLSFSRCEDIQESFPSRLYSSLRKARISVLKDEISTELLLSIIEGSRISIIIFSIHYARSKMRLEELTKIMKFHRANDHVVLPIFLDVDPYEVRYQESSFGEAFQGLIQTMISPTENEISRWRTALSEAGGIHGFVVPNFEHSNEIEHIQNIVKCVRYILDGKGPFEIVGTFGVSSQVQEVISMLEKHKSKDVVSIGLWGMGGVGKTTIAEIIFHHAKYEFETTCFLLSDEGKRMRIDTRDKKVLLVVDGVNHVEELDALSGICARFGKGSIIVITTRDSHILKAFQVDLIYSVKPFRDHESLQLLSRTAFGKQEIFYAELIKVCRRMVAYAEGLPIALEVFGSIMRGKSLRECESALMKLSTDLPDDIYETLKSSYDFLDDKQKEMFINIVLFYIGKDMDDVTQKLDGHGCDTSIGISALVDRSLVNIDKNNKLRMHNMLQLMGRRIIRESSQGGFPYQGHIYDVFLSFKGEDTRTKFTSHLYTALCNAGIEVFKDDIGLSRGDHIKLGLLHAIGSSKIAIIVFSKKYAGSKWCLEELSMIMEFQKSNNQVVLPLFYHVDPSEIRNQTSEFGEAFNNLVQRVSPSEMQVYKWRTALAEAAGTSGFVVCGSSDESKNVKDVVDRVCDILDKKDLFVTEHPVGLDNRMQEVITMLQKHQSKNVIMVGIWGMGGIGKTTIAKAIYNEIGRKFEGRSYLSKVRKVWEQRKGKVNLQNQLLSDICKSTKKKIKSIESGKIILRDRLRHKKALVVLDDVDKLAQLNALVGRHGWFKRGSIIIITTRNISLLPQRDCQVYTMKNLDEEESIKLFSWYAFKQESPREDFDELSRDVVAYSGGLPLALEVLGSHLFEREVEEWKSVLEKLKKIPNDKIQKKLKISFDGLDNTEKDIFLDISCFLIGMDKDDVKKILNGCELFADIGIKTFVERSLITIDEKNKLGMHDLLRDMGREIVRRQSQKELGKRSRIWLDKDALVILSESMGTDAIEGLSLKLSKSKKNHLQTEAFEKMKRLRLLHLEYVQLRGGYECISRDLRWLCWHGCPINYLPSNFYQKKLVAIDIQKSSLRQMWKEPQLLKRLKILNLSHSPYLVQTPDFSKLSNLETLILKDCPSLSMIDHSIGLLQKLILFDLEDCIGLHSLPRSIYRLKCLKTLIVSGCMNIEKLEEDIEQMKSLTSLIAPTIKQVPFSLVKLKSILHLSLWGHEGLSHHVIPSLYRSWVSPTNNPLPFMLTHAGIPSSILWDMLNNIHGPLTIPSTGQKQKSLLLKDGLEIPDSLCATTCMDILRTEKCLGHLLIQIGKNVEVFRTLLEMVSQGLSRSNDYSLPGDNYPHWLAFKGEEDSVKFKVPLVNGCDDLKGMTICCIYFPSGDLDKACKPCIISLMIINYSKATTLVYKEDKLTSLGEVESKEIISNLESDDQVEVKAIFGNGFIVKETIVYLIYNESFDEEILPSTSEATNLTSTKHKYEEDAEACQSSRPRKKMKI